MPELPEVETIVRGLRKVLIDLEFAEGEVHLPKCIGNSPEPLFPALRNKRVLAVERRGKNILLHVTGGKVLIIHLRMSGRLRFVAKETPLEKHTHVILGFKKQSFELRFVDPRQFGRISLERKGDNDCLDSLSRLGPEPLELSAGEFISRVKQKSRAMKPLLLDQHFLAGVGNIYADETLHLAGIHPRREARGVEEEALLRLYRGIQTILKKAIRAGGTSVRSYVNSRGSAGAYQRQLKVYGREGEPCFRCGTPILRERIGGRSSFYCPRCQVAERKSKVKKGEVRKGRKALAG
jgi:formamidopyrimidine-DNA glycosylase